MSVSVCLCTVVSVCVCVKGCLCVSVFRCLFECTWHPCTLHTFLQHLSLTQQRIRVRSRLTHNRVAFDMGAARR